MAGYAFDVVTDQPAKDWDAGPNVVEPKDGGLPNPKDAIGDTKPPLHLVPEALVIFASQAMKNGADKYGPFNWRDHPILAHVYISAIRRHLAAWFDGEDFAGDSGVHHLAHAAAGLAILLDAMATGNLIDDRPTPGPSSALIEQFTFKAPRTVAEALDLVAGRTPSEQAAWDWHESRQFDPEARAAAVAMFGDVEP
jgi:hypothetical protein